MATKNESIRPTYYLILFIICVPLYHAQGLSHLQPGDELIQAIGSGLGAIGFSWFLSYLTNLACTFFKKQKLTKKARTSIWLFWATWIVLGQLLSSHHINETESILNKINVVSQELHAENKDTLNQLILEKKNLSIDVAKYLSPAEITAKDGFKNAKNTIQKYREYITKYSIFLNKFNTDKLERLKTAGIDDVNFMEKYKKSQKDKFQEWETLIKNESKLLDIEALMVNLIESNIDQIAVENDVFIFDNTDALNKYNEYSEEVQRISEKEQSILTKIKSYDDDDNVRKII